MLGKHKITIGKMIHLALVQVQNHKRSVLPKNHKLNIAFDTLNKI